MMGSRGNTATQPPRPIHPAAAPHTPSRNATHPVAASHTPARRAVSARDASRRCQQRAAPGHGSTCNGGVHTRRCCGEADSDAQISCGTQKSARPAADPDICRCRRSRCLVPACARGGAGTRMVHVRAGPCRRCRPPLPPLRQLPPLRLVHGNAFPAQNAPPLPQPAEQGGGSRMHAQPRLPHAVRIAIRIRTHVQLRPPHAVRVAASARMHAYCRQPYAVCVRACPMLRTRIF
mmetsp:Transcript_7841/g.23581  ORF Transcript_7841/g.23581 Transcript_7841/m.23581 type:complete len:234 (+) Transcript_7841:3814-4515(+)